MLVCYFKHLSDTLLSGVDCTTFLHTEHTLHWCMSTEYWEKGHPVPLHPCRVRGTKCSFHLWNPRQVEHLIGVTVMQLNTWQFGCHSHTHRDLDMAIPVCIYYKTKESFGSATWETEERVTLACEDIICVHLVYISLYEEAGNFPRIMPSFLYKQTPSLYILHF